MRVSQSLSKPYELDTFSFGHSELSKLTKHYCLLFNKEKLSYFKQLRREYSDLKSVTENKMKARTTKTCQDKVNVTERHQQFS